MQSKLVANHMIMEKASMTLLRETLKLTIKGIFMFNGTK
jgi:hypothetical protein